MTRLRHTLLTQNRRHRRVRLHVRGGGNILTPTQEHRVVARWRGRWLAPDVGE
jgi:hypothetical protein